MDVKGLATEAQPRLDRAPAGNTCPGHHGTTRHLIVEWVLRANPLPSTISRVPQFRNPAAQPPRTQGFRDLWARADPIRWDGRTRKKIRLESGTARRRARPKACEIPGGAEEAKTRVGVGRSQDPGKRRD
jgi:hypothetical protein